MKKILVLVLLMGLQLHTLKAQPSKCPLLSSNTKISRLIQSGNFQPGIPVGIPQVYHGEGYPDFTIKQALNAWSLIWNTHPCELDSMLDKKTTHVIAAPGSTGSYAAVQYRHAFLCFGKKSWRLRIISVNKLVRTKRMVIYIPSA